MVLNKRGRLRTGVRRKGEGGVGWGGVGLRGEWSDDGAFC